MTFLIHKAVYFIWLCKVMYSTGNSSLCTSNASIPVNCSEQLACELVKILLEHQSLFNEAPPNYYNVPQQCSVNCSVLSTVQPSTDGVSTQESVTSTSTDVTTVIVVKTTPSGNEPNAWLLGVVFGCIGLCCLVAIIVVIYFKKKGTKLFRVGPGCHDNNNFLHNFQIRGHKYIPKKSKHGNDYAMTTDLSGSQALTPVEGRENFYENADVINEKNVPNGKTPPSSPKGRNSTSRPLKTAVPSVSAGVEKNPTADLSGSQAPTPAEGRENIYENSNVIDEKNVLNGKTPPPSPKGRKITSRPLKTAVPSVSASVEETPNQNTISSADAHPVEHQPQSVPPLSHQWNNNKSGDAYKNQINYENHESKIPLQDSSAGPKKKEKKKKKSVKAVQKPRPLPPAPHIP